MGAAIHVLPLAIAYTSPRPPRRTGVSSSGLFALDDLCHGDAARAPARGDAVPSARRLLGMPLGKVALGLEEEHDRLPLGLRLLEVLERLRVVRGGACDGDEEDDEAPDEHARDQSPSW